MGYGSGTLQSGYTFELVVSRSGVGMPYFESGTGPEPDGRVRVTLTGEVDIVVADVVLKRLMRAVEHDGTRVVEVDLGGVTLLDAAGVGTLLAARKFALAQGRRLVVAQAAGTVRRVLEITGALGVLTGQP